MKKIIFPACLALFSSITAFSQSDYKFVDKEAVWNILSTYYYQLEPVIEFSTLTLTVGNDVTINGNQFQTIVSGSSIYRYLRQDSIDKIYYLDNDTNEHILFDFSLTVGDTFYINANNLFVVDSVDSVDWGGVKTRIFLNCIICWSNDDEVWVQGVGLISSSFSFPFTRTILFDCPGFELLCYSENSTKYYGTNCYVDSVIYLSIEENESTLRFKVYPNPTEKQFTVSVLEFNDENYELRLFDVLGRNVLISQLQDETKVIDVGGLNNGIYFYAIRVIDASTPLSRTKGMTGKLVIR